VAELSTGLDGFVIATVTTAHALVIEQLLGRRAPIFVEKPLTPDPETTRQLVQTAADRIFVMDKWRYHPGVEELARIARSGELGSVNEIRTRRLGWNNPHPDVDAVWILAPHDLAIALEIMGSLPLPHSAFAECSSGKPTGLLGILGEAPRIVIDVSCRRPVRERSVLVAYQGGVATLPDPYSDHILVQRDPNADGSGHEAAEKRAISNEMPLLRELRVFTEYIKGGPPPRSSAAEGLLVVERIAALRRLAGLPR
jgi:predicted dehydrogenase